MTRDPKKSLPVKDAAAAYEHFGEAVKHEITRYSVLIVPIKNDQPDSSGSGTCIKVGSRYFVFTAAHVIRGFTPDDLWLITKSSSMNRRIRPLRVGIDGGAKGQTLDVGYIELDLDALAKLGTEGTGSCVDY